MGLRKGIDRGQEGRSYDFGVAVLSSETLTRYFPLSSNLCRLRHPQAKANYPVLEINRGSENATGRPVRRKIVPRRPGDPPILVADPGKAQRALGWTAERNLGDTVSRAWIWMRKNSKGEQAQLSML